MGLAASQARFLAITSRKAYCEFESMQLAQDKLSVTRDLADVSKQYQNALNQTKLVWDYDGTGENPYNLSYGVLMTPTDLNNYNPYLITTRTGSVVLNGQLAGAAKAISSDGKPVNRSDTGFATFVDALAANGVLSPSTAATIKDQEYKKNAGYGAEPLNKNGALTDSIVGLAYRLEDSNIGLTGEFSTNTTAASAYKVKVNGNFKNTEDITELTFSDLLKNDIVYMYTLNDNGDKYNSTESENNQTAQFKANVQAILDKMVEELGKLFPEDIATKKALESAKTLIEQQYLGNTTRNDSGKSTDSALNDAVNNASNSNSYGYGNAKGKKNNDTIAINLSNMMAAFLTNFELVLNGFNSAYSVGATVGTSYFVTDDPYYNYVMKDENAVDSVTVMQADFYMQLYNNICINGWTQNDSVEDENYLENALKNGTYFITSLNGDGYFYQGRYNEEDCVVEITDQDAIAQAEAEFTYLKTKLTYKEEQIDLNMKNLDTEISSLTTEYDSVKNLISKNIEKVFNMFQ